jgi:hypothetical protein
MAQHSVRGSGKGFGGGRAEAVERGRRRVCRGGLAAVHAAEGTEVGRANDRTDLLHRSRVGWMDDYTPRTRRRISPIDRPTSRSAPRNRSISSRPSIALLSQGFHLRPHPVAQSIASSASTDSGDGLGLHGKYRGGQPRVDAPRTYRLLGTPGCETLGSPTPQSSCSPERPKA